jgi:hypothetical protein
MRGDFRDEQHLASTCIVSLAEHLDAMNSAMLAIRAVSMPPH